MAHPATAKGDAKSMRARTQSCRSGKTNNPQSEGASQTGRHAVKKRMNKKLKLRRKSRQKKRRHPQHYQMTRKYIAERNTINNSVKW